jgi:thermitase
LSRAVPTTPILVAVLVLGSVLPAAAADEPPIATTDPDAAYVTDHVIVRWEDEGSTPAAAEDHGLPVVAELPGPGAVELVGTEGRPVEQVVAELNADPAVAYAEPDYIVHLADEGAVTAVPVNDAGTGGQYSLDRMMVRDAWHYTTGGSNLVAVLDTGVEFAHPDLQGRLVAGHDFVNNDSNASDDNGHGTWVTGIIAANANNGIGGAGISWSDKVLPVKIMDSSGTGTTSDLNSGIVYAADRGAKVINMSVGGFPFSQFTLDAVNYAWSKGAVLVGAAGNNAREELFYPASYGNVLSISATQVDDELAFWTSYGSAVDISAPGASVYTTNCYACKPAEGSAYTYISGTSFATPNVAGVVALIFARNPTWTNAQVVPHLMATLDDLGFPGWDKRYGRGRINAFRAVGGAPAHPALPSGDGLEPNETLGSARFMALGTIRPSLHPAGDVDYVAVDAPRPGRIDITATGMTDARPFPWTRSALPIDPIIEVYDGAGTLLRTANATTSASPEVASVQVAGPTRLFARIRNALSNGNRAAYTLTAAFVDNVAPVLVGRFPGPGATNQSRFLTAVATFSEAVSPAAGSVGLRDLVTGALVPVTVTVAGGGTEVRVRPVSQLAATRAYRLEIGSGVRDVAGLGTTPTSWDFVTGLYGYGDIEASPFKSEIAWLTESGITTGCAADRFCPTQAVTREQMASFLVRALSLPATGTDFFADDAASVHQADINRLAASGITGGCAAGRFCPTQAVTREQMASFLVRALRLPATGTDFFGDDAASIHQADINRLAASGITGGCAPGRFCPGGLVTREQMAAFLQRALGH